MYFCAVLNFTFLLILIKDIETIYLNHVNGIQFRGFFPVLFFISFSHTHSMLLKFFRVQYKHLNISVRYWARKGNWSFLRKLLCLENICFLEILIYSWKKTGSRLMCFRPLGHCFLSLRSIWLRSWWKHLVVTKTVKHLRLKASYKPSLRKFS